MQRYQFRLDIEDTSDSISVEADSLEEAFEEAHRNIKSHTSMEYYLDYDYSEDLDYEYSEDCE